MEKLASVTQLRRNSSTVVHKMFVRRKEADPQRVAPRHKLADIASTQSGC